MALGASGSDEVRLALRDGSTVVVRQITAGDREGVRRGFERLSEQSRYQRFLTGIGELSDSQLAYLTEVDHHDHEALIAYEADGGTTGVGVARFVRLADGVSAEAAVTVVDDWQGRGLGTALCTLLAERAREEDVERFTALLLASNEQMLDVLAALGPVRTVSRESGMVEVEVELPRAGIGEQMAGVLRVAAGGTVELATPPWGLRQTPS
ncbi:MAG: GNAT family N-acetyltransferase [Solirubrobacterales bacterium]